VAEATNFSIIAAVDWNGFQSKKRRSMPRPLNGQQEAVEVRKPQISQVADITTSFLTGPISLHSILTLETGNLSCADLHRHVAVHPFISFPIIQQQYATGKIQNIFYS
jgi:hypothetical protein